MMRKYRVRFGGGLLEKGYKNHLASCLPYFMSATIQVATSNPIAPFGAIIVYDNKDIPFSL